MWHKFIITGSLLLLIFTGWGGLQNGYDEVPTFCSGADYRTSDGVLRANAYATSKDMQISREKALSNARLKLSEQIEVLVKNTREVYLNETGNFRTKVI